MQEGKTYSPKKDLQSNSCRREKMDRTVYFLVLYSYLMGPEGIPTPKEGHMNICTNTL